MPRILLDTEAMAEMSSALGQVQQELGAIAGRLARDAAVLMPPATAAAVAVQVTGATAGAYELAARYTGIGAELDARRKFAVAVEGGGIEGLFSSFWDATCGVREIAEHVHGSTGVIALVAAHSPVSRLNGFDVPFIRLNYASRAFGRVGLAFEVIGGIEHLSTAWEDTADENWLGREVTLHGSLGTDVLFHVPWIGAANILSLGSLRADAAAVYTMGGAAVSQGSEAAVAAFRDDMRDHDYLGLGWNVSSAALAGGANGANEGLDTWSRDVADGKWGGILAGISHAENSFIDDHYDEFAGATQTAVEAVSSAGHDVAGFVGDLFH